MRNTTIDFFATAVDDLELSQYKFLALLKDYSSQIRKNKLYPSLERLIEISRKLILLLDIQEHMEEYDPNKDIYHDMMKYSYKDVMVTSKNNDHKMSDLFLFSKWALPLLVDHIEEGKVLHDFVNRNLELIELYNHINEKDHGFFMVEDNYKGLIHLYKYNLTETFLSDIHYTNIKTNFIDMFELSKNSYSNIDLIFDKHQIELFNSVTYIIHSEIDFPFKETVLPLAKTKLIKEVTPTTI